MPKCNRWYVLAKVDKRKKYGFSQITPSGKYYVSLNLALKARSEIGKEVKILKRMCQPLDI